MSEDSELYFDVAAMATSAANIHALFQSFSETLQQIDEYFSLIIAPSILEYYKYIIREKLFFPL